MQNTARICHQVLGKTCFCQKNCWQIHNIEPLRRGDIDRLLPKLIALEGPTNGAATTTLSPLLLDHEHVSVAPTPRLSLLKPQVSLKPQKIVDWEEELTAAQLFWAPLCSPFKL